MIDVSFMEALIERVIGKSMRMRQLKASLAELATSVSALATSVHGLAKAVHDNAEALAGQASANEAHAEAIKNIEKGLMINSAAVDALQQYMGVSIVLDEEDDEQTFPCGMFALSEGEGQGEVN